MAPAALPELMEELVEEILLRFPPDDPACLAGAALICKLWCRLVCGAVFRRRYGEFHRRAAPLLGLLYNKYFEVSHHDKPDPNGWIDLVKRFLWVPIAYFVPTTTFHPVQAADGRYGWHTIDARHSRVLLCRSDPRMDGHRHGDLSVWDPVENKQQDLPEPPFEVQIAALACAATAGGNCDHLDCRRRPFLVVAMDIIEHSGMHVSVYSSEAGAWSKVTVCEGPTANYSHVNNYLPGILVRSALYILVQFNDDNGTLNHEILKYNFATQQVSTIRLPSKFRQWRQSILVVTDDDGGLGFVASFNKKLQLWSRVDGADGEASFVLTRVIDLRKVLPSSAFIRTCDGLYKQPQVNGLADSGASRVLFIRTCDGLYSIEINSSQVKKIPNCCGSNGIVPYISFCTPTSALGCASRGESSSGGSASASKTQGTRSSTKSKSDF